MESLIRRSARSARYIAPSARPSVVPICRAICRAAWTIRSARGRLYLGSSQYRIHGSNEPDTIGAAVSSGCIRMTNKDVVDLYSRAKIGAKVVVLN